MARRKMSTFERLQKRTRLSRAERRDLGRRLEKNDPGLSVIHPDTAGIDVGKESHFVAVPPGRDVEAVREFGSWTDGLWKMVVWLKSCGIRTVVMQSTGVYWVPLEKVLKEAGFAVSVVNARGTKNLPGRKSDVQECEWLRKLHTYGLLRDSFRPPEEVVRVQTVWRHRQRVVKAAAQAVQRMQKALTKMNVQLASAISDISGQTGMTIIREIVAGERNPWVLAKLRHRRIEASEEEIARSPEGHWREDLLWELEQVLEDYDHHQKQMEACDKKLEEYMAAVPAKAPVRPAVAGERTAGVQAEERAGKRPKGKANAKAKNQPRFDAAEALRRAMGEDVTTIPSIHVMTGLTVYSEIGADLSAFPSEEHFCSWAQTAPWRDISGGKVIRQVRRPVENRVGLALRMAAESLAHSDSYLGAKYRQLRARLGGTKANKAMARYLACLIYRLLTKGQAWVDRGAAYYEAKRKEREMKALERRAATLGLRVVAAA